MTNAEELSRLEYNWWNQKTSEHLDKKISNILLFKDEIGIDTGFERVYYKKSEITDEVCPVSLEIRV